MNYKEKALEEILNSPFKVGEKVWVMNKHVNKHARNPEFHETYKILAITDGVVKLTQSRGKNRDEIELGIEQLEKITLYAGYDPFLEPDMVENINFPLSSIIHGFAMFGEKREYKIGGIPIKEVNYNPFVYIDGNKYYYQRPLVWPLEYKQNLIKSIYQNIECGRILVRKRSYSQLEEMQKAGETELAFKDIVDGKQRMHTIKEFINNEWPDNEGRYYCELSDIALNKFEDHKLFSYIEMPESTPDEAVLRQFLISNISFHPQSPEHLKYVEGLYKKLS